MLRKIEGQKWDNFPPREQSSPIGANFTPGCHIINVLVWKNAVHMYVICMYTHMYVHTYVCTHICMYTHMYVHTYVCTHICMYTYECTHMYAICKVFW
jgi:hypothetical protein